MLGKLDACEKEFGPAIEIGEMEEIGELGWVERIEDRIDPEAAKEDRGAMKVALSTLLELVELEVVEMDDDKDRELTVRMLEVVSGEVMGAVMGAVMTAEVDSACG